MTLDEMLADAKTLNDDDLAFILRHLLLEKERRDDAERKEDWANLCKTVENFISKWGSIAVYEKNDYMTNVIVHLRRGEFTFPEFGEIEVGA